mmetsp:Transcript_18736/g.28752  ORF Transcript_18736/g.28752 Transcript_18736/m.28752 type:complete len:397 (-) Transcript_18736:249-1439(-)
MRVLCKVPVLSSLREHLFVVRPAVFISILHVDDADPCFHIIADVEVSLLGVLVPALGIFKQVLKGLRVGQLVPPSHGSSLGGCLLQTAGPGLQEIYGIVFRFFGERLLKVGEVSHKIREFINIRPYNIHLIALFIVSYRRLPSLTRPRGDFLHGLLPHLEIIYAETRHALAGEVVSRLLLPVLEQAAFRSRREQPHVREVLFSLVDALSLFVNLKVFNAIVVLNGIHIIHIIWSRVVRFLYMFLLLRLLAEHHYVLSKGPRELLEDTGSAARVLPLSFPGRVLPLLRIVCRHVLAQAKKIGFKVRVCGVGLTLFRFPEVLFLIDVHLFVLHVEITVHHGAHEVIAAIVLRVRSILHKVLVVHSELRDVLSADVQLLFLENEVILLGIRVQKLLVHD